VKSRLRSYLRDPFLNRLWTAVRAAGPLRSISVDLTHLCNLRCHGCYFFEQGMDTQASPEDDDAFDDFVARERQRGTNFVTVVGGEPSLALDRLKTLHDNFRINVATNGLQPIPRAGFENLPIGVSVWGAEASDRELRGGGTRDVFAEALCNYKDDERAFFYYTAVPGRAHEIEEVVERCADNGNRVLFNFYSDLEARGGSLDHRHGFGAVRGAIERAIAKRPAHVLISSWFAEVVDTGRLAGDRWGHATCTSISPDHEANAERIHNGSLYNPHFRAYNADFATTRRCCTGVDRDCGSCFDTWERFSWVMLNMRKHLRTQEDFTHWLTTMYLFYFINRLVDVDEGAALLPELHRRTPAACAASAS